MDAFSVNSQPETIFGPSEPVLAELVVKSHVHLGRSWVFRFWDGITTFLSNLFGICSVIICTAVAANIPVLQLVSFGYLLEVSGRIGRGGTWSDGLVGISKASRIGSLILGIWLLLIPIRFFTDAFWYEAYLIDSQSSQTQLMRIVQLLLIGLTVLHIVAACVCGGKLRYFFWPIIAPFSFGLWAIRKMLGTKFFRPVLSTCLNWVSPSLTNDICNAAAPRDWFLPAILWKKVRQGRLYQNVRDGLWQFFADLNLWHYFKLGFVGFIGTAIWLALPTILLVAATRLQGVSAGVCGALGSLLAIPTFALLLFVQTHFASNGKLKNFFEVRQVISNIRRAPLAHVSALLLALLLALPLFLLKIENIPVELFWTLSLVLVVFSWPSRIVVALAYRRGTRKSEQGRWWVRYPEMTLALPVSAAFVLILFVSRYVSWHGAFSMIENHVFLMPAPFWLGL